MHINDLDPDTLKKLGLKKPRVKAFTVEQERTYAIKVLNVIADLKWKERSRVIKRALKMNGYDG